MKKWEYFVAHCGGKGLSQITMLDYGKLGWELCSVIAIAGQFGTVAREYYFKREIPTA